MAGPTARAPQLKTAPVAVTRGGIEPLRFVVYGGPKIGKTTFGLSWPRPLIINTDYGLEGDALEALDEVGGVEHRPDGYRDLEGLYFWIRENKDHFDTIVLDSGDELIRILLDEIVDEGKGGREGSSSGALGQTFFDLVPEQAEYLANQRQLHRFLAKMRLLEKHMVITFGQRQSKTEPQKMTYNVSPGLQPIVHHWASVIGRLVVDVDPKHKEEGNHRILLTDAGNRHCVAGSRYRKLTPYVVEPTFDKVWSTLGRPPIEKTNSEGASA